MDGATLYSKWVLAAAETGVEVDESWDELDPLFQAAWQRLAENLDLDYKFPK